MSQREILLKLAEDIESVIKKIEEDQHGEKLAAETDGLSIGTVGSTPASGTNPLLDFLFN